MKIEIMMHCTSQNKINNFVIIVVVLCNTFVFSQQKIIRGKVLNSISLNPLSGVMVIAKELKQSVTTNQDGEFRYLLSEKNINDIEFVVSCLGMKTQRIKLKDKNYVKVFLEPKTNVLKEIVITSSYGTHKIKEEVVGSVIRLKSKDIQVEQATESIDKMIEGQIAGVLIENTSGIGTPVKINIRGQGTLSNNTLTGTSTQPLIIIDGIILTEESGIDNFHFDGKGVFSENSLNPLNQISPESIESLTVLKDAAAVGLYGADGANGVILIKTKKGKKGKPRAEFSSQIGISSAINKIKYLSGEQYQELRNDYLKNSTSNFVFIPYNGTNTDWFNLLNETGIYNKYNFNYSGASKKILYRASFNYLKINEAQKGNQVEQLNASINLGYKINKFKINMSLNPSYANKVAPNNYYSYAFVPTLNPYKNDGNFAEVGVVGLGNPLAAIKQNTNQINTLGLLGSLRISQKIFKGITLSSLIGISYADKIQNRYFSGDNESGRRNGTFKLKGITYPNKGIRVVNQRNINKWNWHLQASLNKIFQQKHKIDGVLGVEASSDKTNFNYRKGIGFINSGVINSVSNAIKDDNPKTSLDETTANQTYRADINNNTRISVFSQLSYNYNKRYFFLANLRTDDSSVFGGDTNRAYNGGVGVSWLVSKQSFMTPFDKLDLLKLKISYGTTGNSRIGSYKSKGLYTRVENTYNGHITANTTAAPNKKLGWEKNTKFNAGIDLSVFQAIELSAEYYYDAISEIITNRNIPTETGYSFVQLNAASMYNRGWEFTAKFKWVQNSKFKWTTSFTTSTLKNKVTELKGLGNEGSLTQKSLSQKVGYSTTAIWGTKWVGIDTATGRDLLEKNGQVYDAVTYRDLFGSNDWEVIGNTQPKVYGGFNNSFAIYNKIDVSIRGSFQLGGDFLAEDELISKYSITTNRNLSVNAYDYWRFPGDNALQPVVTNDNLPFSNSTKYLYDATYLKINNIHMNYKFNTSNFSFLKACSFFIDVSNVAYWYKDKSPRDRNGYREFRFKYPQSRTISCGLKAKF